LVEKQVVTADAEHGRVAMAADIYIFSLTYLRQIPWRND
jgi:hypothetical protein